MNRIPGIVLFALLSFLLMLYVSSCNDSSFVDKKDDLSPANRTVLVYMVGENSLSRFLDDDLAELKNGVADMPVHDNLIVYVDGLAYPYICKYGKDSKGTFVCDTVKNFSEDLISTDSATMSEIVNSVFAQFPADSYGMVLWSHGDGWLPDFNRVKQRYIGIDNGKNDGTNSGKRMNIEELAGVLGELEEPLDFIFFDACFMQTVEVVHTLRNVTRYIVASPAEIPGPGAPYQLMVKPMFAQEADVEGMVNAYYSYYNDNRVGSPPYGVLLSAIDCSKMDQLALATAAVVPLFETDSVAVKINGVQRYYPSRNGSRPEYYDMNGTMRAVLSENDYLAWKEAFDEAVPYKQATTWWYSNSFGELYTDMDNYGGVSWFVPQDTFLYPAYSKLNNAFRNTSWYFAAGWDVAGW